MSESLTNLFKKLGAPLANSRWSWGAIRPTDGAVFLRIWDDRKTSIDGKYYFMITHHAAYHDKPNSPGYQERVHHVARIKAGAPCYLIMCHAKDKDAAPREIQTFISDEMFVGGNTIDHNGDTWIDLVARKPASQAVI